MSKIYKEVPYINSKQRVDSGKNGQKTWKNSSQNLINSGMDKCDKINNGIVYSNENQKNTTT